MFLDLVVLTTTLRQRHGPTSVHLSVAHHVDFESLLFQQQLKNLGRDQTRIVVHLEGAPGQVRVEVMDLLLGEVRSEDVLHGADVRRRVEGFDEERRLDELGTWCGGGIVVVGPVSSHFTGVLLDGRTKALCVERLRHILPDDDLQVVIDVDRFGRHVDAHLVHSHERFHGGRNLAGATNLGHVQGRLAHGRE